MSRVFLLRHARAGWAAAGMRDFDRPLEPTGLRDAERAGAAMAAAGYLPERILCSSATRARETWEAAARSLPAAGKADFLEELYSNDATGYLTLIREQSTANSLLVVGHNPMMEDLALALAADGDATTKAALQAGFPACGLAVIDFAEALAEVAPGGGRLKAFLTPADY